MTTDLVPAASQFDNAQVDLIKRTVADGTTDDELALFLQVAQRTGLDPFARQIYAVIRNDKKAPGGKKMSIQTGIDGYRLIAQRTGLFRGRVGPYWCGPDGVWHDVWLAEGNPSAAKVGVMRADCDEPIWAVATWRSYAQTYNDGNPSGMWANMGDVMLAKCAEAQAIRATFPADTSGVYTAEEMDQTVTPEINATPDPAFAAAIDRVEELLLQADGIVNADEARRYAGHSLAHAEATIRNIEKRLASEPQPQVDPESGVEVVDAELVDDEPAVEEPTTDPGWDTDTGEITGDVEPATDTGYDWRADAGARSVTISKLLVAMREGWPTTSQWNLPNRSKDLDALAADEDMAKLIAATIADLAGGR